MKSVLFYWSKGAPVRAKMVKLIAECNRRREPVYLARIAEACSISDVAAKKHLDLMVEHRFVAVENPQGKPHYLTLTREGWEVAREFGAAPEGSASPARDRTPSPQGSNEV